jgi:hypothetical protein
VDEFFTFWLQLSTREQAEDGSFRWASLKPAVGSAEIRELLVEPGL